jgi:hypothetical protein
VRGVGTAVGTGVGIGVGVLVGAGVGIGVGTAVGTSVGIGVGVLVGAGTAVAVGIGVSVGNGKAVTVGATVEGILVAIAVELGSGLGEGTFGATTVRLGCAASPTTAVDLTANSIAKLSSSSAARVELIAAEIVPSRSAFATEVCSIEILTVASMSVVASGGEVAVSSGEAQLASAKKNRIVIDNLYREVTSESRDASIPPRNDMPVGRQQNYTWC